MANEWFTDTDYTQLTRLIAEIAWRLDHGKADTLHELFVEDGEMTLTGPPAKGTAGLKEWAAKRAGVERHTQHICTNMHFVPTERDHAEGTTTLTIYLHDGPPPASAVPDICEYHDEFVRRDGKWLFKTRKIQKLFSGVRPDGAK